ncbi:hypothetical protein K523DRAFT_83796 [Schizophyllum commune Tattone D]|nr:hypothetical protein K523DRAFT_83796 [Schizophyllum commune Tattone D]
MGDAFDVSKRRRGRGGDTIVVQGTAEYMWFCVNRNRQLQRDPTEARPHCNRRYKERPRKSDQRQPRHETRVEEGEKKRPARQERREGEEEKS